MKQMTIWLIFLMIDLFIICRTAYVAEITEEDINFALTPIHTIVWAVKYSYYYNYSNRKNWAKNGNKIQVQGQC